MQRSVLILAAVFALLSAVPATDLAQTSTAEAKGLLVCKDLQTGYVEVLEYTGSTRVNDFTDRYSLVSGNTRQFQTNVVATNIRYPVPGTTTISPTQLQANLEELAALTQKYPRYAALFNAASTRLQNSLVSASKVDRPASSSMAKPPATITLVLRDGTAYQDVRAAQVGADSLTIMHRGGVLEIPFQNLPDDLAGLPDKTKDAIVAARKARNEARRSADERALAKGFPSPPDPTILTGMATRRDQSVTIQKQKLAQDANAAQADADRSKQEYEKANPKASEASEDVTMLTFVVERKLNKVDFGGTWPAGSEIYQIRLPSSVGGGLAILQTNDTSFRSEGRATMYVGFQEVMHVEMKNGFDRHVPVYVEVPSEGVAAANAERARLRGLRTAMVESKKKADAAREHQQLFDYATTKFSALHLAPICHVSGRLQALGFQAQVASARWNKVIELTAQADWPGLVKAALGAQAEMTTRAEVDSAFDQLAREPVAITIKSSQVHLVIRPGSDVGYLERPGERRTVSVGALVLPITPTDLLNPMNGNRINLSTLPALVDLRESLLPDGSGYVARWMPKDADVYFCLYVSSPNAGEKAASAEFDALRRSVQADSERINLRKASGQLSETDSGKEIGRTLGDLFTFARGPLTTDY